jgi:hypothetical protein
VEYAHCQVGDISVIIGLPNDGAKTAKIRIGSSVREARHRSIIKVVAVPPAAISPSAGTSTGQCFRGRSVGTGSRRNIISALYLYK